METEKQQPPSYQSILVKVSEKKVPKLLQKLVDRLSSEYFSKNVTLVMEGEKPKWISVRYRSAKQTRAVFIFFNENYLRVEGMEEKCKEICKIVQQVMGIKSSASPTRL